METIKAYFALTKPRIIELLLVAAIPAMLQAQRGVEAVSDNIWLIVSTIFGGWLGAGAAHTFNNVVDYELDQKMQRTRARPLVRAKISKRNAAIFAWVMLIISVLWLGLLAHSWLAAFFVVLTNFFYVFVYTKFLKMRNAQNIVWGGLAGCMPAMVGWAVIRDNAPAGEPDRWWQAVVLFLIIFFWTPPHTWALAMKYKEDYRKAGVPMLPVVAGEAEVTRQIVWYTVGTVIVTLLIVPAASWIYLVAAVASGAVFLWMAIRLHKGVKNGAKVKPMRLFIYSNNYLSVLFIGLSIDAVLGWEPLGRMLGWSATLF
ncbi:heme o synthase [Corynebacterium kefirresidentii]|uniref:heme o synthase n=1 Tax=Corynebacterium TaxID=1716 RepID=UPI0003B809C1|nr:MULTISPECIES: heme o synthase [Corynebacterium]WKS54189.1 heme o synthase [Corynebacterium tuberculostearicum]ERS46953.1 protoheme IX farnesyltransferase [Corynebacterium sp. KPL1856]ERS47670.1 protoheme IX farnesyltransferase [Corynebacterium sp. KPL1860]ERS57215.1 protoheme IX farnesyltransferase [Corynebacterium sp. KPL1821]ERS62541.1 protoheme IX farnesyltransferase [Corynebacterium sp. KPL1817]